MIPIYKIRRGEKLPARISERSELTQKDVRATVQEVIQNIRTKGDDALFDYTFAFDKVRLTADNVRVTEQEIRDAYAQVPEQMLATFRLCRDNITAFHELQKEKTWVDFKEGQALGQLVRPLSVVGAYVPGGTAPLSSTVMMTVLPAKVAGVERIVLATPPMKDGCVNPYTLVAAAECGVTEIYKIGGAQAIAALAYGTQSIPRVDKIVGPGNMYVSNAKREVYGIVGIDMIAGPSEVLVLADKTATPRFVAADLLSQAEHGSFSAAILVTPDQDLAQAVQKEVDRQLTALPRKGFAGESIEAFGAILVCEDLDEGFRLANEVAPEHLELSIADAFSHIGKVKNAGACFLGHYSPEPLGDYFAGPDHVLPTSGTARFFSPLGVQDFLKRISIIQYSREQLEKAAPHIERFALAEGLDAHARSAAIRFRDNI